MSYEDARRHLDPLRDFFEARDKFTISDSFVSSTSSEPSFILTAQVEFIGAYLRDELIVAMFRFDDTGVDMMHIDNAYEAIRKRIKKMVASTFPQLPKDDLAVHVMTNTGNVCDFEF